VRARVLAGRRRREHGTGDPESLVEFHVLSDQRALLADYATLTAVMAGANRSPRSQATCALRATQSLAAGCQP
jgi:hypothetical protein